MLAVDISLCRGDGLKSISESWWWNDGILYDWVILQMWCVCLTKVQLHAFFFTGWKMCSFSSSFLFCFLSLFSLCVCDLSLILFICSYYPQVHRWSVFRFFQSTRQRHYFVFIFHTKGNAEICCELKTRWLNVLYLTEKPAIVSVTEGSVYFDVQYAVKRQNLPDLFSWEKKKKNCWGRYCSRAWYKSWFMIM